MIHRITQYLRKKLYHMVMAAQFEKAQGISNTIRSIGANPFFSPTSSFLGTEYMELGNQFHCGKNSWVEAIDKYYEQRFHPRLVIGDNFSMQYNCHIGCIESIEIGDNVLLGSKVYITDHNHGNITKDDIGVPPAQRPLSSKPVKIGDNVTILPGVILGNNVIVGANAVVTKSFPDNAVIVGCPAKVIKMLE